jgi:acyl-CoA synthetase (AMP-forming)/AMP-acid ligase II
MQPKLFSDAICAFYHEAGYWGDKAMVDYVDEHALRTPEKPAIIDCRETIDYATLKQRTENVAAAFSNLGLREGDVVAVRSANWAELPMTQFAANRIGAISLPLSEGFREKEILHILRIAQARILLTASGGSFDLRQFVEAHRDELPHLEHIVLLREAPASGEHSFDLMAADNDWRGTPLEQTIKTYRRDPDKPSHCMVSSGTTGLPKCSLYSDNNTLVKVLLQYCGTVANVTSADVAAAIAPAGTGATGYNYPVLVPLLIGGTSVMLEHWSGRHPEEALKLIQKYQCSYAVLVPTQLAMLAAIPNISDYDLHSLRHFTYAGAKLPASVAEKVELLFQAKIQCVYGCSEAGTATMTSVSDTVERRLNTVGRALAGQELLLLDDNAKPVETGGIGEICWRGPNKSYGFLNDPEGTKATWDEGGWIHSGDLGTMDDEGYLQIVGRKKDMIIRGGQNINPRAIEEILLHHPLVVDVAIAPIPDEVFGERVGAFVVTKLAQALTLQQLWDFVLEHGLAKWHQPEILYIVDELPRNAGGKTDKTALLKRHATIAAG